ncbi:MAG: DUF6659 family protein [Nitrosopumilus sp.]
MGSLPLSSEKVAELEDACMKLLEYEEIRFVGIINHLGNMIAGGFKKGIEPLLNQQNIKMVFMQMNLDFNMRQEYDEILGDIDYITSRRKKQLIINVPLGENFVLITAEPQADDKKIIKMAENLFDEIKISNI